MAKKGASSANGNGKAHKPSTRASRIEPQPSPLSRWRYARQLDGQTFSVDPAQTQKPGELSPNMGRDVIPQVLTFQGLTTSISRAYRNPDEAIKHSRENAIIMRKDPVVMECLEARQRAAALLNWHLETDDPDQTSHKELIDCLTRDIKETPRFTEFRRSLMEGIWYGRAGIQNKYHLDYRTGKKRVLVKKWTPIHGDKLCFRFDDGSGEYDGDQVGIRLLGTSMARGDIIGGDRIVEPTEAGLAYFFEKWERSMLVIHRHMIEDAAYEDPYSAGAIHGIGIRSRIYWAWFQKQQILAMLMEHMERSGIGIWIYGYPAGDAAAEAKVAEVAANQVNSNRIIWPRMPGDPTVDAYTIDRIDPSPAGAELLLRILDEYFGGMVKRYILGQKLTTEAAATGLGSGVADLHQETFMQIVRYDSTNLEETLTTDFVRYLQQWGYPKSMNINVRLKIDTEAADTESKLQAAKTAWDMGAGLKEQDVMDLIGFSTPTADDKVLQNPAMQQQPMGNQAMGATLPGQGQGQPGDLASMSPQDLFGPLAGGSSNKPDDGPPAPGGDDGGGGGGPPGAPPAGPERYARVDALRKGNAVPRLPAFNPAQLAANNPGSKWDASKHPRGQPENKGEFGPGGAGAAPAAPGLGRKRTSVDDFIDAQKAANAAEPIIDPDTGKPLDMASYKPGPPAQPGRAAPAAAPGSPPAAPGAAPPAPPAAQGAPPAQGHQQRHATVQRELPGVQHPGTMGLMKSLQEDPDYKASGTVRTADVHPKLAQDVHGFLTQHAGTSVAGGHVVDLGNGKIGFASRAGSLTVQPPTARGGKWQVEYTNQTKPVEEAGMAAPGQDGTPAAADPGAEPAASAPVPPKAPAAPTSTTLPAESVPTAAEMAGVEPPQEAPSNLPEKMAAKIDELHPPQGEGPEGEEHHAFDPNAPLEGADGKNVDENGLYDPMERKTAERDAATKDQGGEMIDFARPQAPPLPQTQKPTQQEAPTNASTIQGPAPVTGGQDGQTSNEEDDASDLDTAKVLGFKPTSADPFEAEQQAAEWLDSRMGGQGTLPEQEAPPTPASRAKAKPAIPKSPKPGKATQIPGTTLTDEPASRPEPAAPQVATVATPATPPPEEEPPQPPAGPTAPEPPAPAPTSPPGTAAAPEPAAQPPAEPSPPPAAEPEAPAAAAAGGPAAAGQEDLGYTSGNRKILAKPLLKQDAINRLQKAGIHSPENEKAIHDAIESGDINTWQQLQSIVKQHGAAMTRAQKKKIGKKDLAMTPEQHSHAAMKDVLKKMHTRAEGNAAKNSATADIRRAAQEHGVDERDLNEAIDFVHEQHKLKRGNREEAKLAARDLTKMNAGDIKRLGQNFDYASVPGFDDLGRQLAASYPDHMGGEGYTGGGGRDTTDYAANLWQLLSEGQQAPKARHEHIDEALEVLKGAQGGMSKAEIERLHSTPFAKRGEKIRYMLQEYYARYKPAANQLTLNWDEKKHPRKDDGEFTTKGSAPAAKKPKPEPKKPEPPKETPLEVAAREYQEQGTKAPHFKGWFGDWEKDQKNCSKVVNGKGEPQPTAPIAGVKPTRHKGKAFMKPIRLYHGTAMGGFEEFDPQKLSKQLLYGPGFYFTENPDIAAEYMAGATTPGLWPTITIPREQREKFLAAYDEHAKKQGFKKNGTGYSWETAKKSFLANGKLHEICGSTQRSKPMIEGVKLAERYGAYSVHPKTRERKPLETKAVYLNIRKPYDCMKDPLPESVFKGLGMDLGPWRSPKIDAIHQECNVMKSRYVPAKTIEAYRKDAMEKALAYRPTYEEIRHSRRAEKSRIVDLLRKAGYDGMTHMGGHFMGGGRSHRVWIAFDPRQIKAVDNRGTFDKESKNYRYQKERYKKAATEALFCYGSLLDGKVRQEAIGHAVDAGSLQSLGGYTRQKVHRPKHAFTIVAHPGMNVAGEVFHLTPAELQSVDNWEEDYRRTKVTLANGQEAWAYVQPEAARKRKLPIALK